VRSPLRLALHSYLPTISSVVSGGVMLRNAINTQSEYSLALARIVLAWVFFAHGAKKMLGWFGGSGFSGTITDFAKLGMPTVVALYAILVEFCGGHDWTTPIVTLSLHA
jgi:uncharacterized membrane protein